MTLGSQCRSCNANQCGLFIRTLEYVTPQGEEVPPAKNRKRGLAFEIYIIILRCILRLRYMKWEIV